MVHSGPKKLIAQTNYAKPQYPVVIEHRYFMTSDSETSIPRQMYAGIFLSSVAVLMLQVLLTRIFSFTIWYHLAYLTISTALLGFGAAGSILAGAPRLWSSRVPRFCALCSAGAGVAIFAALLILAPWPLDPRGMTSTPGRFFIGLFAYYIILAIPFVLAGLAVATPLSAYPARVNRLYAVDLLGAGLGCLVAVGSLMWMSGPQAIVFCSALFIAAAAVYADSGKLRMTFGVLTIGALGLLPFSERILHLTPTESKVMGHALTLEGTEVLYSEWSPVNRVDVIKDKAGLVGYTFWGGYGISPHYKGPRPGGYSIEYDGHNGSVIYRIDNEDTMQMLDEHILRTPYLVLDQPDVLVIGVGGGIDVLNALRRDAKSVTGVELQPITVRLHEERFAEWTGGQFQRPEVNLVAAEGRHYARSNDDQFDIVQVTMTDTFSAQSTGAYVLAESYLYTVEAFDDYFSHLNNDGVISFILGDLIYDRESMPPAMATRLALAARQSLAKQGITDPARHMIYVGQDILVDAIHAENSPLGSPEFSSKVKVVGSTIGNFIVKKSPFTDREIRDISTYAAANGFRVDLVPGQPDVSPFAQLVNTPNDELAAALKEQSLYLSPATDDKPFFYHVLRWRSLLTGERILWSHPGSTTGQLVLLMMLIQSIILGFLLILLPILRGARETLSGRHTFGFLIYFLSLGVGFMLIEISFVQKYVLLLGYPTYSLSVTIFSLLIFAATGAALSRRFWSMGFRPFLLALLAGTIVVILAEVVLLPSIRQFFLGSSLSLRILVTFLLQLPVGMCLGMYFTTGIEILRTRSPRLVPWAWAINGIGSVLSTVLAVILAMAIGFSGVALVAIGVYTVGIASLLLVLGRSPDSRA